MVYHIKGLLGSTFNLLVDRELRYRWILLFSPSWGLVGRQAICGTVDGIIRQLFFEILSIFVRTVSILRWRSFLILKGEAKILWDVVFSLSCII